MILDTSEIQARKANPQAREISRLTWRAASIPQNAIPFTVAGKPYLLETDEYTQGTSRRRRPRRGGRGAHHRHLRRAQAEGGLEPAPPGQPAGRPRGGRATTPAPPARCRATPRTTATCRPREDPTVVACSFIASGLRVFDISELTKPKEIAYYVAPTQARGRERVRRQRLRDVQAGDRAEPARGLVQRRRERLLQPAREGRWPGPSRGRPRLPGAPVADRPAQHRPRADRAHARPAAAPRARARAGAPSARGAGA